MKKITFIAALIFAVSMNQINAQDEDHKLTISANAGFSLVSAIVDAATAADVTSTVTSKTPPAIQLNVDYGLSKVVSIGAAFSMQSISLDYNDPSGSVGDYSVGVNRMNFSVRPLFHYANSGMIDLYSGLRIGYKLFTASVEGNSTYDKTQWDPLIPMSFQIIPFGMRVYPVENIGINAELGMGAPHYLSAGLSFRL